MNNRFLKTLMTAIPSPSVTNFWLSLFSVTLRYDSYRFHDHPLHYRDRPLYHFGRLLFYRARFLFVTFLLRYCYNSHGDEMDGHDDAKFGDTKAGRK